MNKPKYVEHYPIAETMPPLNHWPDRSAPFSFERSEVNQWLAANLEVSLHKAETIRGNLSAKKILTFDPEARLWRGAKYQTGV